MGKSAQKWDRPFSSRLQRCYHNPPEGRGAALLFHGQSCVVVSQGPRCVITIRSLDPYRLGDLLKEGLGPCFHNTVRLAIPVSGFSAPYHVADLPSQLFMRLHMDWIRELV